MNSIEIPEREAQYVKFRKTLCMLLFCQMCTLRTTIDQILLAVVMLVICETVFLRQSTTAKGLMLCAYVMSLVYVVLCSDTMMIVVFFACAYVTYESLSLYRGGEPNVE